MFDYSPVGIGFDDDEDELLRRGGGYAPVVPAPDASGDVPASAFPAGVAPVGSTADLESREGRPRVAPIAAAPTPAAGDYAPVGSTSDLESRLAGRESVQDARRAPQWKDYAPVEPHGWSKFGHVMAGFTGPTNEYFNVRPERQAEERYKNAVGEYEAPLAERAKTAEAEQKESQAELERAQAGEISGGKLLSGDENVRTQPNGTRERAYQMPGGRIEWRPEGEGAASGAATGAAPGGPTAHGGQPVYGKPTEKELPASVADIATLTQAVSGSPYLTPEQKTSAAFPEGYTPTQNELKTRMDAVRNMETNARQGKQDEFNDSLKKIAAQNAELLAQAHLTDLQDKQQKADAQATMTADSGYAGLYAQENYKDKAQAWHKSPNFAKDSGIVDSIVNQAHGESGLPSIGGGATIGALIGGVPGAVAGAAAPALGGLIMPMAQGYLDAAKRAGISAEGYQAMQAYFNALPARMSYEMQIQGLSSGVMRSRDMIQKVLQTVPPPNTPGDQFEGAFNQYFTPMKTLTEKKAKLIAPTGYQPPPREAFYPAENGGAHPSPEGTRIQVGDQVQVKRNGKWEPE